MNIFRSMAYKATAFVLTAVLGSAGLVSGLLIFMAHGVGCYETDTGNYFDTKHFENTMNGHAYDALSNYDMLVRPKGEAYTPSAAPADPAEAETGLEGPLEPESADSADITPETESEGPLEPESADSADITSETGSEGQAETPPVSANGEKTATAAARQSQGDEMPNHVTPSAEEQRHAAETSNFAYEITLAGAPGDVLAFNYKPRSRENETEFKINNWSGWQDGEYKADGVAYVVRIWLDETLPAYDQFAMDKQGFDLFYPWRYRLILYAAGALLAALLLFIGLLVGAGRRPGREEAVLNPLDRTPLEVYLGLVALALFMLAELWDKGLDGIAGNMFDMRHLNDLGFSAAGAGALLCALVMVATAFCMGLSARLKEGKWWRRTLVFKVLNLLWRGLRLIPIMWKGVALLCALQLANLLIVAAITERHSVPAVFLYLIFNLALLMAVCYLGMGLAKLKDAGKKLAAGDLAFRTDGKWLKLDFLEHAENLNAIGQGMAAAVEQRMRGERMKTELITNVSHDLKTPITSIVNYVDLLGQEELTDKAREYVEVLERQARRLSKLTSDLVEASKASTGNMPLETHSVGIRELVEQALGEYGERLAERSLEAVAIMPEDEVYALADGRHLWRIMDNLLSNVCKYSMPGTRVYANVAKDGQFVKITVSNISNERLDVSPDELTERFVRGDAARSAEGSGLGLNIARSLTELQKGVFNITVDGDLFKASVSLPAA